MLHENLDRRVLPSDLDASSHELLERIQNAIRVILGSVVYSRYLSDSPPARERALRGHEWDIAVALKNISKLTRENKLLVDGSPGPMTAAVLDSQRQTLKVTKGKTESRISALERYASELQMADAADRDWQTALEASSQTADISTLLPGPQPTSMLSQRSKA
jgi:hypothetical protein